MEKEKQIKAQNKKEEEYMQWEKNKTNCIEMQLALSKAIILPIELSNNKLKQENKKIKQAN